MDPIIGSLVGAGASAFGNFLTGIGTNATNLVIANRNLAFERENLEYQKELQNKIFDREDTAYQRTVDDMRASGLNPLAMKGTNGAGQAIQTTAPQNKFVADPVSFNNAMNTISSISSVVADNKQKNAQADLLKSQKDEQDIVNKFTQTQKLLEIESMISDIENRRSDTDGKKLSNDYQEKVNKNYDDFALEELNRLRADIASVNADTNLKNLEYDSDFNSFIDNKKFWSSLGLPSGLDYETKILILDVLGSGAGDFISIPENASDDVKMNIQHRNYEILKKYSKGKEFKKYMEFLSGALSGGSNIVLSSMARRK